MTYRALVDLVVAGKGVNAGSTFETTAEQAAPAVAFGLAEVVERKVEISTLPENKPTPKRSTRKAR